MLNLPPQTQTISETTYMQNWCELLGGLTMMTRALLLPLLLLTQIANADPIKIAVIDTGISPEVKAKIGCSSGHKDFTGRGLDDVHGHGTHVSGLIDQYAKDKIFPKVTVEKLLSTKADYCQIFLKFFHKRGDTVPDVLESEKKAFKYAIDLKVDVINFSGGGEYFDLEEKLIIKEALDKGIIVVVAAGNDGRNLSVNGHYYPAMYDSRLFVVGNLQSTSKISKSSNYGVHVNVWNLGENMISLSHESLTKLATMSGTSQATAIVSGKIIKQKMLKLKRPK